MRYFFLFTFLILVFSCGKKTDEGVDILPSPKMTVVLWDMIQVDEFATSNLLKDSSKNIKIERIKLYDKVFKLHKISEKEFASSFKYYTGRPDLLKVIFDSLSARADRERRTMYLPRDSIPKKLKL